MIDLSGAVAKLEAVLEELTAKHGCTCGGTDIGVGVMHEPGCGDPDLRDVERGVREALADLADVAASVECDCGDDAFSRGGEHYDSCPQSRKGYNA